MNRKIKASHSLYIIGILVTSIGFYFYNHVVITDNWLGDISAFFRKEQSIYLIYSGFGLLGLTLLLTGDYLFIFKHTTQCIIIIHRRTSLRVKIFISLIILLYMASIHLNATFVFFSGLILLLSLSLYFGLREHKAYLIATLIVLVELSDVYIFYSYYPLQVSEIVDHIRLAIYLMIIAFIVFMIVMVLYKIYRHIPNLKMIKILLFILLITLMVLLFRISFNLTWSLIDGGKISKASSYLITTLIFNVLIGFILFTKFFKTQQKLVSKT
jgi:hypothetical protein